ncbi:MAG: hypothetical protein WC054_09110, partial [Candidatus Nanopelagicales bacterium]
METVHVPAAAIDWLEQLSFWIAKAGSEEATAPAPNTKGAPPVFVTVTISGDDGNPITWLPKSNGSGEAEKPGIAPV